MARKSVINAGQVNEDRLEDADGDTLVQVEESADEDKIRFDTGGTERMIIDNAGNVGIGTSTPDYELDVAGDIGIGAEAGGHALIRHNGDSNTYIRFISSGDAISVIVGSVWAMAWDTSKTHVNPQNADHDFRVETVPQDDSFFVDGGSGKVGIGTDTPTAVLHVSGSDAAALFSVRSDSNIDLFTVTGSGQVGIGTPDPQTTLHVKGDPGQFRVEDTTADYAYTIDCDGDGIRTHFGDMTGGGDEDSFMSFGAYTGINRLDTASRDFHIYGTNTTTGFYFDESAGSFGIGTATPGSIFHVSGSAQFNIVQFAGNSSVGITDYTCVGDCGPGGTNGNMTLTLPVATNDMAGRIYVFKRTDTGGMAPVGSGLTVGRNGKMIDGDSVDFVMNNNRECVTMQCAGAGGGWIILSHYVPI
jgi:hypothetical protein